MAKQWQAVAVRDGYALDKDDLNEIGDILDADDYVRIELVRASAAPNDGDSDDEGRMPGSYATDDHISLWEDFDDRGEFDIKFKRAQAMAAGMNEAGV